MLAAHFEQAGDADRAVDHLIAAGDHALQRLANREGLAFYERADAALPSKAVQVDRRLKLLLGLGRAQQRARSGDEARATFNRAAELARARDRAEQLAEAALGSAEAWLVWDTEGQLVRPLEEALERLPEGPSPLRARVLARLAQALYADGTEERRQRRRAEAEEVARAAGDDAALAEVLLAKRPLLGPDDLEERLRVDEELVAIGERTGDLRRAADGHGWRLVDVLERGDIDEADRALERHAELAEQLGEPLYQRDTVMWRAMRALLAGRYGQAEELMEEARRIGVAAGGPERRDHLPATTVGHARGAGESRATGRALGGLARMGGRARRVHRRTRAPHGSSRPAGAGPGAVRALGPPWFREPAARRGVDRHHGHDLGGLRLAQRRRTGGNNPRASRPIPGPP